MLLRRFDDDLRIVHVQTPDETDRWREGFVHAYRRIFRDPPYEEDISLEAARSTWDYLTSQRDHITLIAATEDDDVVGFGIAIPLSATRKVAATLAGLVPQKHTYYLAELGVLPSWRGRGLGGALIRERIKLMDPDLYSHVVLRVSADQHASYDLYRSMGFEDMGVYMQVEAKRIDGHLAHDRRLFLSRVLSQVDVA